VFTAAVGQEDEGDVVVLEVGKGLRRARDWDGGAEKYAIYTGGVTGQSSALDYRCGGVKAYSNAKAKSGGSLFAGVLPERLRAAPH
jgi:hypothetical protein